MWHMLGVTHRGAELVVKCDVCDCIVLVVSMRAVVCQVCPVCAAYPGGEPNHVIDDLAAHLMLEHRTSNNDLISFVFARDSDSFRPD